MSQDASAGRLHVEVTGDTTGFRRGLQRRIDAEVRDVRARILLQADARRLAAEVQAAARAVRTAETIKVRVEADTRGLADSVRRGVRAAQSGVVLRLGVDQEHIRSQVEAAARSARATVQFDADVSGARRDIEGAARDADATIRVDADTAQAQAQIEDAARDADATVEVTADTSRAEAEAEATRSRIDGLRANIQVGMNTQGLDQAAGVALAVGKVAGIAVAFEGIGSALAGVVGGLGAVASGLFAIVSASGAAVGALAVIPPVIGGIVQAAGTALAGFSGIGDAVKALGQAETAGASGASAAAGQREAAARRVADAQRNLARAEENVARAAEAAAERIAAAQERVADARAAAQRAAEDGAERLEAAERRVADARENVARVVEQANERVAASERRVADTQRQVANARDSAARAAERASQQVESAERRLAEAQRDSQRAQEDLTRAREVARERLEDLQLTLRGSVLDEEAAMLAVERARNRLNEVNTDPRSKDIDRREADLALRQALLRVDEVRERNADLQRDAEKATRAGVEGSEEVVSAQERIADSQRDVQDAERDLAQTRLDAVRSVQDAQQRIVDAQRNATEAEQRLARDRIDAARSVGDAHRDLADAERDLVRERRDVARSIADANDAVADSQRDLARTVRDSNRSVVDAQRGVQDAQRGVQEALAATAVSTGGASAALSGLSTAMDNLSPAGQRFARFLYAEVQPALKALRWEIQEALLPSVETGIRTLLTMLPEVTTVAVATAGALGRVFVAGANMVTSPEWRRDFVAIGLQNADVLETLGMAGLDLLDVIRNLTAVAVPQLLVPFSKWVAKTAEGWKESANLNRENGKMEAFFVRTRQVIAQWSRILGNVVRGFYAMGVASSDAGQGLLNSLEASTKRFETWAKTNQATLAEFFEGAADNTRIFGDILVEAFQTLGRLTASEGVGRMLTAVRDQLAPALDRLLLALAESGSGEALVNIIADLADVVATLVEAGALDVLVDLLELLAEALKDISDNPIGAEVLAGLVTLASIGGAFGLVAGGILKVVSAVKKLAKVPGAAALLGALGLTSDDDKDSKDKGKKSRGKIGAAARRVGGAIGKGGALGIGATVAGGAVGTAVDDEQGGARSAIGGALQGGMQGAATGAMLGAVIGPLGVAGGAITGALIGAIGGAFDKAGPYLTEKIAAVFNAAQDRMRDAPARWAKRWDDMRVAAGGAMDSARKAVDTHTGGLATFLKTRSEDAGRRWSERFAGMKDATGKAMGDAGRVVEERSKAIGDWLKTRSEDAGRRWSERFTGMKDSASRSMTDAGTLVSRRATEIRENLTRRAQETRDNMVARFNSARDNTNIAMAQGRDWVNTRVTELRDRVTARSQEARNNMVARFNSARDNANIAMTQARDWVNTRAAELRDRMGSRITEATDRWRMRFEWVRNFASDMVYQCAVWVGGHLNNVRLRFWHAVDDIRIAWDRLRQHTRAPVQFMVDVVFNNGLLPVWNGVAGLIGAGKLSRIKFAKGGVLPGYTPGRDVHEFYSPTGEALALSGGEGILVPEAVHGLAQRMGTTPEGAIQSLNSAFSARVPGRNDRSGYAGGGLLDWVKQKGSQALGAVGRAADWAKDGAVSAARSVGGWVMGGLRAAAEKILNPIRQQFAARMGGGDTWASGMRSMASKMFTDTLNVLKRKDSETAALAGGGFYKGHGASPIGIGGLGPMAAAARAFVMRTFGLTNIGGYSNRNIAGTGQKSDHALGKAIDVMIPAYKSAAGISKGNQVASWFVKNAGVYGTKYVIWKDQINTGGGWRSYGHPGGGRSDTLQHRDHVHVSFLGDGGVVNPRRGGTLAMLGEKGRSEAVVDEGLLNARLSDMQVLSDLIARGKVAGTIIEEGAIQVGPIYNPVPETVSDTANRRLRALAAFGLFEQ